MSENGHNYPFKYSHENFTFMGLGLLSPICTIICKFRSQQPPVSCPVTVTDNKPDTFCAHGQIKTGFKTCLLHNVLNVSLYGVDRDIEFFGDLFIRHAGSKFSYYLKLALGKVTREDLTERELEIIRELTASMTNEEIAEKLNISVNTVKRHIQNIMEKTGFESRLDLAMSAKSIGLVVSDSDRAGNRRLF